MKVKIKLSKVSAFLGILTVFLWISGFFLNSILVYPLFFALYFLPFLIPIYWILLGSTACYKEKKAMAPFYGNFRHSSRRRTLPSNHLIANGIMVLLFSLFISLIVSDVKLEELDILKFKMLSIISNISGVPSILGGILYYFYYKKKNPDYKNKGKNSSSFTIRMINGRIYPEENIEKKTLFLEDQLAQIKNDKSSECKRYEAYVSLKKLFNEKRK